MKSTGVTRRIDELGRIVIPKEIRRILAIRDGETLEVNVEDNKIILKKFLVMQSLTNISEKIINIINSVGNDNILITDREKVIAVNSIYENLLFKSLSNDLIKFIDNRESTLLNSGSIIKFEEIVITSSFAIAPIINEIDCLGLVIIINNDNKVSDDELKLAKIVSKILSEKINLN